MGLMRGPREKILEPFGSVRPEESSGSKGIPRAVPVNLKAQASLKAVDQTGQLLRPSQPTFGVLLR